MNGEPFYHTLEKMARLSPMAVFGRSTMTWTQHQGDGHCRLDLGLLYPENFADIKESIFLMAKLSKKFVLAEFFDARAEELKVIIRAIGGPFNPWPLYDMPPNALD